MNTKKSTALAATIAAVTAFALILVSTFSGVLLTTTTNLSSNSGPTTTPSGQSQSSSQTSAQQSTTQQSSTQQSSTQQDQGTLSILLTDPPNVPDGVTKVYVSYADLAVHVSGAATSSGWTTVKASGSIELLGTVNVSQTISSVRINTGTYNLIRFNITNAEVTYDGKNYTAYVQTNQLIIPIVNGIGVVASTASATMIDISPTVINTGSQTNPEFIISSVASAYPVPSTALTVQQEQVGSQVSLTGSSWWQAVQLTSTAHLSIGSASLNATYLNLKVSNTGGNSTILNLVTITPVVNVTASGHGGVLPTALGQSAIFIVLSNGTLMQVQLFMNSMMSTTSASAISASLFAQRGLVLPPGATATLTHHGTILLGFMGIALLTPVGKIIKGQHYLVTVIGQGASANLVVTAS
ncbi:MAG: DUF4382 domain-containing protein [Nitrososphaerales archaeon]|jgi:hypothetical protein